MLNVKSTQGVFLSKCTAKGVNKWTGVPNGERGGVNEPIENGLDAAIFNHAVETIQSRREREKCAAMTLLCSHLNTCGVT